MHYKLYNKFFSANISFIQLLDENINYSLGLGSLPVEKTSYSIPADYKITDGLSGAEVIESQVLLKNK